jgi:hypothetical protein
MIARGKSKTKTTAPIFASSWPWYKAMGNSFFHPNDDTGKALLLEGNISFRQALIWVVTASIILGFFNSTILWIKFPFQLNFKSIFLALMNCFLSGVLSSVSLIVLTGFIHIVAKLFGGKGNFQKFFIVYIAFNVPVLFLFFITALIGQIFRSQFFLFLLLPLCFYFFLVITTKAIKANYHFHWLGAFLINLAAQIALFLSIMAWLLMSSPGLIKK